MPSSRATVGATSIMRTGRGPRARRHAAAEREEDARHVGVLGLVAVDAAAFPKSSRARREGPASANV